MRKPISLWHPWLYRLRVAQRRWWTKHILWRSGRWQFATQRSTENLPFRCYRHSSRLLRKLGATDMQLQHNKVINLNVAIPLIDGVLIHPGETFSFCRLVGLPTRDRGFVEGLELSFGRAQKGVGGGICQIANMVHWLALHSPLQVTARSNHSFDPFPDEGRVLPFGTGAAIFYNFVDLKLFNPTENTFQFRLWLTEENLVGELRSLHALPVKYHVYQKAHAFRQEGGHVYRYNEIWRDATEKQHNPKTESTFLYGNRVRVMYPVAAELMTSDTAQR